MEKLMMPAAYNVMSEEEMAYTEGGSAQDTAALIYYSSRAVLGIVVFADYVWGVVTARNWISANKKKQPDVGSLLDKGVKDLSEYMGKSLGNALVGGLTAINVATQVALWPVTAIAWITA